MSPAAGRSATTTGPSRRALLLGAALSGTFARPAAAAWPLRPVRVLYGFAGVSANDVVFRRIAQALHEILGQAFVLDVRPGAGGNIAMDVVAKSAPDGYTLGYTPVGPLVTNPLLGDSGVTYDAVTDFTPITQTVNFTFVLMAHASVPSEPGRFLDWLRANPREFYASPGIGSTGHLLGAQFSRSLGIDLQHVPYRTSPTTDLLEGRIRLLFNGLPVALPVVRGDRVRAVLVTSADRHPLLPDVPTCRELGFPEMTGSAWYGLVGPAGLDDGISSRLRAVIAQIIARPEVASWIRSFGLDPAADPAPGAFADFLASERLRWRDVIRQLAVRAF